MSEDGGISDNAGTVTALLRDWRAGDRDALDRLVPLVYDELYKIADKYMRGERAGHTFKPTDLVSEAYLRLSAGAQPELENRVHFYAVAARTMRQILVDHARRRAAHKRGSNEAPVALDESIAAPDRPEQLVALDAALTELAELDERRARVLELRYFGGLTLPEIAQAMDVHANTVGRDLKLAEAWIHQRLRQS